MDEMSLSRSRVDSQFVLVTIVFEIIAVGVNYAFVMLCSLGKFARYHR